MIANKNAYTFTELLVVVLLIGILSSLVLPRITGVVDSFRLLEAERLMQAVRNEQEQRCALDKKYTPFVNQLAVLPSSGLSSVDTYITSNFRYILVFEPENNFVGMKAVDLKNNATLEIPSFLDGRICCSNCQGLNRNYLDCAKLMTMDDYEASPTACEPPSGE